MFTGSKRIAVAVLLAALVYTVLGCTEPAAGESGAQARADSLTEQDKQMLAWCRSASTRITAAMERWVKAGLLTEEKLFSFQYHPIPNTSPQKFHTDYDALSDRDISPIQEDFFTKHPAIKFLVLVDRNGYLPTHNLKYSKPVSGDKAFDLANHRTKRIFNDRVGLAAARNTTPFLLQSYTRDSGEVMNDVSVPVFLFGKAWGAVRLGYVAAGSAAPPPAYATPAPQGAEAQGRAEISTDQDRQMVAWGREAAGKIVAVMERWVKSGLLTEEKLFAFRYTPIPGHTDPPRFQTDYDGLSDQEIAPIQEVCLARAPEIRYVVLVDRNGYLPTHNLKYTKPLTGDRQVDQASHRTKRFFKDPVGLAAARSTSPSLLQRYARDSGEAMKDLALPISLFGKHWGALRIGYSPN